MFLVISWIFLSNNDTRHYNCNNICWSVDRKLEWADFKGKPSSLVQTYYGDTADVVSVISIYVDLDSSNNYFVKTVFDKNSWYEKGKNQSQALEHEQKHFDLTEIYSRKLRKRIEEEEYRDGFDIDSLYQEIMNELNIISAKYDVATAHGAISLAQSNWSEKIQKELIELDTYADTNDYCP